MAEDNLSMKLILHIGAEKTGTTSIQSFLAQNSQEIFSEQRILYPIHSRLFHGINHGPAVGALLPPESCDFIPSHARIDAEELLRGISAAVSRDPSAIIISSEHYSSRLMDAEVEQLRNLLSSFDVQIVLAVRRPDEFFMSAFSTYLKSGGRGWFKEFAESMPEGFFDCSQIVRRWDGSFGIDRVSLIHYDKSRGSVIDDFCVAAGIEMAAHYVRPGKLNERLGPRNLVLMRALNEFMPSFAALNRIGDAAMTEKVQALREALSRHSPLDGDRMASAARRTVYPEVDALLLSAMDNFVTFLHERMPDVSLPEGYVRPDIQLDSGSEVLRDLVRFLLNYGGLASTDGMNEMMKDN